MDYQEYLYDLFFEISSQERHKILRILTEETANLTQLSNKAGLNLPETRRHISRLVKVDLVERIPNGSYSLTNFGVQILETVEEIAFFSQYRDYFLSHSVAQIPREFQVKLRDLANSEYHDNILNFIRRMEGVIREAKEQLFFLVDQFPLNHLSLIMESIEKGVNYKIIEPRDRVLNPDLGALAPQESLALDRIKMTPQVEQRMKDEVNVLLVVSEKDAIVAFPTIEGEYDYKGFRTRDASSLEWCMELFHHIWEKASPRIETPRILETVEPINEEQDRSTGRIVLTGRERPEYDAPAIQDAVDRYDEVVLKGRFNIGTSTILLKRSVILRGEGRTNDVPDTTLYKYGWDFPFISQEFLLMISGDDIDVTIENIHIENFNGTCIGTRQGNSLTLRKNRITLLSGLGRGLSMGKWGDFVVGITAGGDNIHGGFPGGIIIEDNYLDFALSYVRGGFITKNGRERDPEYRPDLLNHEAPICIGMNICRNLGKVVVRNNVVRNMNSKGIYVFDNRDTADIQIHDNEVISEVFGAYSFNNPVAGVGILIQSAWSEPRKGGRVKVFNNKVLLDKVNYCGIAVHGPSMYAEGAGKLDECIIENNEVQVNDGLYGIQVRKSDQVKITGNKISGRTYYGLQVNGSRPRENIELGSNSNHFSDNNMTELEIKPPDEYSDKLGNYVFNGADEKTMTAHVWLNKYSSNNLIKLKPGETSIDESAENKVEVA
jgi:predicted transcriptional regulator